MSGLQPEAAWLASLRARADRLPLKPRVPLWAGDARIGSVEPDFFDEALAPALIGARGLVRRDPREGEDGWCVNGALTATLAQLAMALRAASRAHAWRDEQLAVTDEQGRTLGTVERAVVRPLGIQTFAVHLAGLSPDGRHWVQQRSLTKPSDPGLWDTLMGGMIPASESIEQALARETWEEAGLKLEQLIEIRRGGRVRTRGPSREIGAGYVIEQIDWYRCVVPEGIVPVNQDGEVSQFRLMDAPTLREHLQRDEFTIEAALVLVEAGL